MGVDGLCNPTATVAPVGRASRRQPTPSANAAAARDGHHGAQPASSSLQQGRCTVPPGLMAFDGRLSAAGPPAPHGSRICVTDLRHGTNDWLNIQVRPVHPTAPIPMDRSGSIPCSSWTRNPTRLAAARASLPLPCECRCVLPGACPPQDGVRHAILDILTELGRQAHRADAAESALSTAVDRLATKSRVAELETELAVRPPACHPPLPRTPASRLHPHTRTHRIPMCLVLRALVVILLVIVVAFAVMWPIGIRLLLPPPHHNRHPRCLPAVDDGLSH